MSDAVLENSTPNANANSELELDQFTPDSQPSLFQELSVDTHKGPSLLNDEVNIHPDPVDLDLPSPPTRRTSKVSDKRQSLGVSCPVPRGASGVWRKIDLRLIPGVTLVFSMANFNRYNIYDAQAAGLQASLRLTQRQMTILHTVTLIPFVLVAVPVTLISKRAGPQVLFPSLVICWGIVAALQGFAGNFASLIIARFFIGLLEGGILPALVLYLSNWYPRSKLASRTAFVYAASNFGGQWSSLLAFGFSRMGGVQGMSAWSWIFIWSGILAIILGATAFVQIPNALETANFLSEEERALIVGTMKNDGAICKQNEFRWMDVLRAFIHPHVALVSMIGFFVGSHVTSIFYIAPPIVGALTPKFSSSLLLVVPPFFVTLIVSVLSGTLSDRYKTRGVPIIVFTLLSIIGEAILLGKNVSSGGRYVALFFLISGCYGSMPILLAWTATNSTPHYRRGTALGIFMAMTSAGSVLSTWICGWFSAGPLYTGANTTYVVFSIVIIFLAAVNMGYLHIRNRLKGSSRNEQGERVVVEGLEPKGKGDRSAMFIYML